jgi:hypothetical protein
MPKYQFYPEIYQGIIMAMRVEIDLTEEEVRKIKDKTYDEQQIQDMIDSLGEVYITESDWTMKVPAFDTWEEIPDE